MDIPENLIQKVLLADDYMDNGVPLKDAMTDYQVMKVIMLVAEHLKGLGHTLDEDEG